MYFITIKRMLEVCFSAHPNIQYRAETMLPYLVRKRAATYECDSSPLIFEINLKQ